MYFAGLLVNGKLDSEAWRVVVHGLDSDCLEVQYLRELSWNLSFLTSLSMTQEKVMAHALIKFAEDTNLRENR